MNRGPLILLLLVGGATLGYFLGVQNSKEEPNPDAVIEVKQSPSVIWAVKNLARIEGASLHLERVIDLREKQSRFFGMVEAEDAILLVAAGDVTAGVDLSGLAPEDIVVDEGRKSARLVIPRATLFSVRVDNERTYVHTRTTDVLADGKVELEAKARQEAERGFREAAEQSGLREKAENSVARTVRALVLSLGFDDVEVTFREPSVPVRGH